MEQLGQIPAMLALGLTVFLLILLIFMPLFVWQSRNYLKEIRNLLLNQNRFMARSEETGSNLKIAK